MFHVKHYKKGVKKRGMRKKFFIPLFIMTKNQALYQKEINRIMGGVYKAKGRGWNIPEGFKIERPKRVTKKRLKEIQEAKPKDFYRDFGRSEFSIIDEIANKIESLTRRNGAPLLLNSLDEIKRILLDTLYDNYNFDEKQYIKYLKEPNITERLNRDFDDIEQESEDIKVQKSFTDAYLILNMGDMGGEINKTINKLESMML